MRLITMFNNQWRDLQQILSSHWDILKVDPRLSTYVADKPSLTARRVKNLKDKLVSSHFQTPTVALGWGSRLFCSFPCGRCNICPFMIPTQSEFINPSNDRKIKLHNYVNCQTCDVIYVLVCPCSKAYVGQTTQKLKKRIQQHLSTLRLASRDLANEKTLTSVAAHFLHHHQGH